MNKKTPTDLFEDPKFKEALEKAAVAPIPEKRDDDLNRPAFYMPSAQRPAPDSLAAKAKKEREEEEQKKKEQELVEKQKEEGKFINISKLKVAAIVGAASLLPGVSLLGAAVMIPAGIWGINKLMENKAAMDTFQSWKGALTEKFGNTDIGKGIQDGSILESVKKLEVPEAVKTTLDAGVKNIMEGKPLDFAGKKLEDLGGFLSDKAAILEAKQNAQLDAQLEQHDRDRLKNGKGPKPM